MQTTTINVLSPEYTTSHTIYIGSHIGFLKKISIKGGESDQVTLLGSKEQYSNRYFVKSLQFTDVLQKEILIGRQNGIVDVYDLNSTSLVSSFDAENDVSVVGIAQYEGTVVAGLANGKIKAFRKPCAIQMNAGTNMCRMSQCHDNRNLIAAGGKDDKNIVKVFDLNTLRHQFVGKNVPHDSLQLKVPIWESDVKFLNPHTIATCSRTGYVRIYDIRKQRRPVLIYNNEERSFSCLETFENYVYVGTTVGGLFALDSRKMKNVIHTYKGFFGGINDLKVDSTGKYIVSGSMDRYVRVHDTETCAKLYQHYVKSKVTRVLLKESSEDAEPKASPVKKTKSIENKENNDTDDEYEEIFRNMLKTRESNYSGSGDDKKHGSRKRRLTLTESKRKKNKKKRIP